MTERDPREVWCAQHRSGWCAVKSGKLPVKDKDRESVATKCGQFVILPLGFDKREPDCEECATIITEAQEL